MMALQTLLKCTLALLAGIVAGAMVGGLLGMASAGPMGVIGGMVLGAMAGSMMGAGVGFWRNVGSAQPGRQVAYGRGRPAGVCADGR